MSWSDENTPTNSTTPINTAQEATSQPISQAAPPPLRRRRSKSQETSARTTAESASSNIGSKEESPDETKMEHKSVLEESIPSNEDSSSIPEAVNTTGDPNKNRATNGTGDGLPDDNPVTKSSEPSPDPNSSLPGETSEAKESIPFSKIQYQQMIQVKMLLKVIKMLPLS